MRFRMGAESIMSPEDRQAAAGAFRAGVAVIGSEAATARAIGKSQPVVHRRIKAQREIWAECVTAFEALTGISRHDLRPDLYSRDDAADPAARFEEAR